MTLPRPRSPFLRPVASLTATAVLLSSLLSPWAEAQAFEFRQAARKEETLPTPRRLDIPTQAARVIENFWADLPASPDQPLVIHIQDVHALYDAQKNLSETIASLARGKTDGGPLLVAVEGAWGPLDLRWLNVHPDKTGRDKTADLLLRAGWLTGEEHAAVTGDDLSLSLVGVEDPSLHRDDALVRATSRGTRASAGTYCRALMDRADRIKALIYPPAARRWEELRAARRDNRLSLADYLKTVHQLAPWKTGDFPQTTLYFRAAEAGYKDNGDLTEEIRGLLSSMEKSLPSDEWAALTDDAGQVSQGKLNPARFQHRLITLAEKKGLKAPALKRFVSYADKTQALNTTALADELPRLEDAIAAALLRGTREGSVLYTMDRRLSLLQSLFSLELTPEDWHVVQGIRPGNLLGPMEPVLAALEKRNGLESPATPALNTKTLRTAETAARRFYALAEARNKPLVENALAEARRRRADCLVLVAGGFHTPGLTRILRQRGAAYLVLAPQFHIDIAPNLREKSKAQDLEGSRLLSASFPPDEEWEGLLSREEMKKLDGVRWNEIRREGKRFRLGAISSKNVPSLILELDEQGNTTALHTKEKDVRSLLKELGWTPPASPLGKIRSFLRRNKKFLLPLGLSILQAAAFGGWIWNLLHPSGDLNLPLQAGGLFFTTPWSLALFRKNRKNTDNVPLQEIMDRLKAAADGKTSEERAQSLKEAQSLLRKSQARDDRFSGDVYRAIAGETEGDPDALQNSPVFTHFLAHADPKIIGRMLVGRTQMDRQEEENSLKDRITALQNKKDALGWTPSKETLEEIWSFAKKDRMAEARNWDDLLTSPHLRLTDNQMAAIKDIQDSLDEQGSEQDKIQSALEEDAVPDDMAARIRLFLEERIYHIDRRLRALSFPHTLVHNREREELRSQARLLEPSTRRQWALETVIDGLELSDGEKENRKEAIWKAFEAALDLKRKENDFLDPLLKDLTSLQEQRNSPAPELSSHARDTLAAALREESPFQAMGLRVSDQKAKEAAALHLAQWGADTGRKLLFVNINKLPMNSDNALEEWRKIVENASRAGRTGLAVDIGAILARYPGETDRFIMELLAPLSVPENPVPFLALATEEEEDQVLELQKIAGQKFYEKPLKRVALTPPADRLPELIASARKLFGDMHVFMDEKEETALLRSLLKDAEAVRLPGSPVDRARRVLEESAAAVRTSFVEGRREAALITRKDLDEAKANALPAGSISSLTERAQALLRENPKDVQGMDPAVRAKVEDFIKDLSSREKRGDLADSHDEDVNKKVAYLENVLRLFGRRLPEPFPELKALEGLSAEEIEKREKEVVRLIIGRASRILDKSHYGMWRAKRTVLRALRVRINQQLAALKTGQKLEEADIPGLHIAFLGPPGGGKTSFGVAIAAAMGIPFVFLSVAGFQDLNTVRGIGYTIENSGPGAVAQALQRTRQWPLLFIDEVDKASPEVQRDLASHRGGTVHDAYLGDYPVRPLNTGASINFRDKASDYLSAPGLLVIEIPGYPLTDKARMAESHLLPRLRKKLRLPESIVAFPNPLQQFRRMAAYTPKPGFREFTQMVTRRMLRAVDRGLRDGTGAASIEEDMILQEEGLPPQVRRVENTPRIGRASALRRMEEGSEMGHIDATLWEEPGASALPLEVFDLRGQVTHVMADLGRQLALRKASQHGATLEDLEGKKLVLGSRGGESAADTPHLGGVISTAQISAVRGMKIHPDVTVLAEITETEEVRPVDDLTALLMAAEPAGIKTVLLSQGNRAHLEKAFLDVPALRGPVEQDGTQTLSFDHEELLEEELGDNPQKAGDVVQWNGFIGWIGEFSAAAGGPRAEKSAGQTGSSQKTILRGTPERMNAWLELLSHMAEQMEKTLEEGIPETWKISPLKEGDAGAEAWNKMLEALPTPPGLRKTSSLGKGVQISGSPRDMEAWFWNTLQLARAPSYILVDHLDEITDRLLIHPEIKSFGDFQKNGALNAPKQKDLDTFVRQARLGGARKLVSPLSMEKELMDILESQPLLKGLVDIRGERARTLRFPIHLAKEQSDLRPSVKEVERWHDFIEKIQREKVPTGLSREETGEWLVFHGDAAAAETLLAMMPLIAESMSYILAAKKEDLSPSESKGLETPRPQKGPLHFLRRLRGSDSLMLIPALAVGTAALGALAAAFFASHPALASLKTDIPSAAMAGGIFFPLAWSAFMRSQDENPDVRQWLKQWEEPFTTEALAKDLEDMLNSEDPTQHLLYPMLGAISMEQLQSRDKATLLETAEQIAAHLEENPEDRFQFKVALQMGLPQAFLEGIDPEQALTPEQEKKIRVVEQLLRHLLNKSPEQAGHLFNALHVNEGLEKAGKNAWRVLDPSLLGELWVAGRIAARQRDIIRYEQRLIDIKADISDFSMDLQRFKDPTGRDGAALSKEGSNLVRNGLHVWLRLLNPDKERENSWTPSLEKAIEEIEALQKSTENPVENSILKQARIELRGLKTHMDLSQGKTPGPDTAKRLESFFDAMKKDRDREDLRIRHLKDPLRAPKELRAYFQKPPKLMDKVQMTSDRLMSVMNLANLDHPERIAALQLAAKVSAKMSAMKEESIFQAQSSAAHAAKLPLTLKKTFAPVIMAARRRLLPGVEERGMILSAPTANVYKLLPQALAEALLEDTADPSPWNVITLNARDLPANRDKAFSGMADTLVYARDLGHIAVVLDLNEFAEKQLSEKHLDALLALWDAQRLPLFISGTSVVLQRFQRKSSLLRRMSSSHVVFDDPAEHLQIEIEALGYGRLQLSADAEAVMREKSRNVPQLLKALEKAAGKTRETGDEKISGTSIREALAEMAEESRAQGLDPEVLAEKLPELPPHARTRAEDLLGNLMDNPARQDQTMATLELLFRYPFARNLPPLRKGTPFLAGKEQFQKAMDDASRQAILRINERLRESHLWEPSVLEALSRPLTTWIHGQRHLELLQWEIENLRLGGKRDDPAVKERISALTDQWQEAKEDLSLTPTFPALVGPSDVSLEQLTALATVVLEEMGLSPEEAQKKLIVISLENRDDVALIEGYDDFYLESVPSELYQKIKAAGVEDPIVIFHRLDAAGEKLQNALLPLTETGTNTSIMDRKMKIPLNYGKLRMFFTADRIDGISGPLQSRLEIIDQPEMTQERRAEFASLRQIPALMKDKGINEKQVDFSSKKEKFLLLHGLLNDYPDEPLKDKFSVLLDLALEDYQTTGKTVHLTVTHIERYRSHLGPATHKEQASKRPVLGVIRGLFVLKGRGLLRKVSANLVSKHGHSVPLRMGAISESDQKIVGPDLADAARRAGALVLREARSDEKQLRRHVGKELTTHFHDLTIDKDGASAGLSLYTLYYSTVFEKYLRPDVAMTGIIDDLGGISRVESLEEKAVAARKAGIRLLAVPADNLDLEATLARNEVLQGPLEELKEDGTILRGLFLPTRWVRPGMSKEESEEVAFQKRMAALLAEEAVRAGLETPISGMGITFRGSRKGLADLKATLRKKRREAEKKQRPEKDLLRAAILFMERIEGGMTYLRVSHVDEIQDNPDIFAKSPSDILKPETPPRQAGFGGLALLGGIWTGDTPGLATAALILGGLWYLASAAGWNPFKKKELPLSAPHDEETAFRAALRTYGHAFTEGSRQRQAIIDYLQSPASDRPSLGTLAVALLRPINGDLFPIPLGTDISDPDEISAIQERLSQRLGTISAQKNTAHRSAARSV
jgi:ATP-dependent Lon protease